MPARAEDQQVGLTRLVDEHGHRRALADPTLDRDPVAVGRDLADDAVERDLGRSTDVAG